MQQSMRATNFAGMKARVSSRGRAALAAAGVALAAMSAWPEARAVSSSTLGTFEQVYKGRIFRLLSNVHRPDPGGKPAPYLDEKRWHYRDQDQPIVFEGGELVEVTGVFPYGDRSLFLELARPAGPEMLGFRLRVRVRVSAAEGPEEPEKQVEELRALIAKFLVPLEPLVWPPAEGEAEADAGEPPP